MKMNSVTVRDASANGEAFTHNVDKQKHKYKKKEDWVWDYLIDVYKRQVWKDITGMVLQRN